MRIIPSFCEKASLYNAVNEAGRAKAFQSGGRPGKVLQSVGAERDIGVKNAYFQSIFSNKC